MTKVAVIGAGRWGQNLVRVFHDLGALSAVAEQSPLLREQLSADFPELLVFDSHESVLRSVIPAVVVATPVSTHYRIAREALLAGKDVFVEKPLTMASKEAEELTALALQQERVLMVGHLLMYQSAIEWMKRYVSSGELGQLHSIHQRRVQLGRVRTAENALWSLGVHDIAVLLHLVGKEPLAIEAKGHSVLQRDIEDDVYVHLSFTGGIQAHLHVSWLWPRAERRMTVIGSRGMLEYDEMEQTVTLHRKSALEDLTFQNNGSEVVFTGDRQPLQAEALHFLHCVEKRKTPRSDGANGASVIRVLENVISKWREGHVT